MNKEEFSQTKTVVSPDGKTTITITINGSSVSSANMSTSTVSTTTTTTTTLTSDVKKGADR